MMYDREASGCGVTPMVAVSHWIVSQPNNLFTDTLTALKCVEENKGCSANHQGANVVVRLEHLPISSSAADTHR